MHLFSKKSIISLTAILTLSNMAYAGTLKTPSSNSDAGREALAGGTEPEKQGDLAGLGFGIALGGTFRSTTDINSTTVENNTIRISDGDKSSLGFWLETHYFVGVGSSVLAKDGTQIYKYGVGPFVGAQASSDNKIIKSLGIGIMFGARRATDSTNSFNIGIGYAATQINVLTDGLVVNQPLPTGITAATTRTKIVGAPFIITSFSF